MNILFICSRNRWRSRTEESVFKSDQTHDFRSAGTENDARVRVNEKLINWADLIFVMEKRHKQRLQERFDQLLDDKRMIIPDIEDNYQYMDQDLIETLKVSVTPYLTGLNGELFLNEASTLKYLKLYRLTACCMDDEKNTKLI